MAFASITATGVVTGAGDSADALFASVAAGAGGPPPTSRRIEDFDVRRYVDRRGMKHMSRGSQLACAAAGGVARSLEGVDGRGVGVVYGSAWGCLNTIVRFERAAHVDGPRFVDPILFTETVANVPAGQVSIAFGWSALNATVSAGMASGLEAIRLAIDLLDDDRASVIVAGGGDETNPHMDRETRGAHGEGACVLAVESDAHAKRRRAPTLGRLRGAVGCFAGTGDGAKSRCRRALDRLFDRAEIDAGQVDLVVVPGDLDRSAETAAVVAARELVGPDRARWWSPMPGLGECWAANGPASLVLALEAMRRRTLPGDVAGAGPMGLERALVLESSATGHFTALVAERAGG